MFLIKHRLDALGLKSGRTKMEVIVRYDIICTKKAPLQCTLESAPIDKLHSRSYVPVIFNNSQMDCHPKPTSEL